MASGSTAGAHIQAGSLGIEAAVKLGIVAGTAVTQLAEGTVVFVGKNGRE